MTFLRLILPILLILLWGIPTLASPQDVLSETDISAYQRILKAHDSGDIKTAKKLTDTLKNKVLLGYILYDRYFSKHYHTKKQEITDWLNKYSDLAVAADMYELGRQKKAKLPKQKPKGLFGGRAGTCSAVFRPEPIDLLRDRSFSYLSRERRQQATKLMKQIANHINNGRTLNARRLIESKEAKNLFSYTDHDAARTALAFSYFIDGEDEKGYKFITDVLKHSADTIPQAHWVAGLISWRQNRIQDAAEHFSEAAVHPKTYPFLESSASFWAARSYLKLGQHEKVGDYLEKATQYHRLFYGILAMRLLAQDLTHVWDEPSKPSDDINAEFSHPALNRFYALNQIGQKEWAQKELSKLYLEADEEARGILLMISQQNNFDIDLLSAVGATKDGTTRYPAPNWTPKDGWKVDKALVYAFVRQESCFNQRAESQAGALGLMQIMPDTGRELAKSLAYPWQKKLLKEPEYNLSLGQNYLLHLMSLPAVGNNLIFLSVAYNAGPGNLIKWKKKMVYQDDPLLFLESIPSKETRSFTERIIVNYWIYRNLMGQPLPSLDATATGGWPSYHAVDTAF